MESESPGVDLIFRLGMGMCSGILLLVYAAGWYDDNGKMLFGIALFFLTLGALARQ